jgi:hypothetical protein
MSRMIELTDAELDAVSAGLVTVVAFDVVDVRTGDILRNVNVQADVDAAAAVAAFGSGAIARNQAAPQGGPINF